MEKKETSNLRVLTHSTYDMDAIWDDKRPFVKEIDIEKSLGWELKPEGLCKDDSCIPYTPLNDPDSGYVDFLDITNTLGFSNILDVELGLAAVLGQKLSAETAEAKRIDRSQGDSTMMVVAQQMQDMIDNCLMFHSQYINSEAGSCFVNRDFLSQRLEPQEIQALLTLYTSGSITQKTLLDQLTEGEVLGDEFDVEEEIEATQTGGMVEMAQPKQEAEPDEPEQDEE